MKETGYDIDWDSDIVKLSIVSQFGLDPYDVDELKHSSYIWYTGALGPDTPLANLVHIRNLTTAEAREQKLSSSQMAERQRWFTYLDSIRRGVEYIDPINKQK